MGGTTQLVEFEGTGVTGFRRTLSLLLPVFLLAALMIMVADRADASTAGSAGAATAAVSAGSSSAGSAGAQISFRGLICVIINALRAIFGSILDRFAAAFGCNGVPSGVIGGGGGFFPDDDDDDDDDDD